MKEEYTVTHLLFITGIYDDIGEYEIAQQCLARAKRLSPNVAKQCMISATIAEMHDKMVSFNSSVVSLPAVLVTCMISVSSYPSPHPVLDKYCVTTIRRGT